MVKPILIILIPIFLVSTLFAGTVFEQYSATPTTNQVTIEWRTSSEAQVVKFLILRSPDASSYKEIGEVSAKGNGSDYTYTDDNVIFKSSQTFFYKIQALDKNGNIVEESEAFHANPNISGIYRTWGAIKAMFR